MSHAARGMVRLPGFVQQLAESFQTAVKESANGLLGATQMLADGLDRTALQVPQFESYTLAARQLRQGWGKGKESLLTHSLFAGRGLIGCQPSLQSRRGSLDGCFQRGFQARGAAAAIHAAKRIGELVRQD